MALSPSDYTPPAGWEALVVVAATVGTDPSPSEGVSHFWFATAEFASDSAQATAAIGTVTQGSDVTLVPNQDIEAVRFTPLVSGAQNTPALELFDNPSSVTLSGTFGSGGAAADSRVTLIREVLGGTNQEVSFDLTDAGEVASGFDFLTVRAIPSAWATVASAVSPGDSIILAITRPVATGALDAGLTGSIAGAGHVREHAAGALDTGLTGSISGDGEIVEPPPIFTPPAGREAIVAMEFTAGAGEWYYPAGNPPQGVLSAGSDSLLRVPDQHISRIRWSEGTNSGSLTLNDNPSSLTFGDTFGAGGLAEAAHMHIVVGDLSGSFVAQDHEHSLGNNFGRWDISLSGASSDFFAAARTVAFNSTVVFAITIPEVAEAALATGALDTGLTGSIAGAATTLHLPALATGALDTGLTGSVAGDGVLIHNATGALDAGLTGSIAGAGEIVEPEAVEGTGALDTGLAGSISGDATTLHIPALATGALDAGLAGSIAGDGALVHNATGALDAGLAGSISGVGSILEPGALSPSDFTAPVGRETVVLLSLTVGTADEWWNTDGSQGSLDAGSDTRIQGDQDIVRVRWQSGRRLVLNDDSELTFGDSFGTGGGATGARFHLLRALPGGADPATAQFDHTEATESLGSGFGRWALPTGHAFSALAEQVEAGDQVILAITRARTDAAGALDTGLTGSIAGAATTLHIPALATGALDAGLTGSIAGAGHVREHAAGSLDTGLTGSISGVGSILEPAGAEAVGTLDTGLTGSIAGAGEIIEPEAVEGTGALDTGLTGSISGAATTLHIPALAAGGLTGGLTGSIAGAGHVRENATGALDTGLTGSISGDGSILEPAGEESSGVLTGGLAGSISGAGEVVLPLTGIASLDAGLAGAITGHGQIRVVTPPPANATQDQQAKKIRLWADTGDRADPDTVGIDRVRGFGREHSLVGGGGYPRRVRNQLWRELSGFIRTQQAEGIPAWDADLDYEEHGFVVHNARIWVAKRATIPGEEPGTVTTAWRAF